MTDPTKMPRRLLDDPDAAARFGLSLKDALRDDSVPIELSAAATRFSAAVLEGARPRFDPWSAFSNAWAMPLVAIGAGLAGVALGATMHAAFAEPVERIVEVEKQVERVVERVVEVPVDRIVEVPAQRVVARVERGGEERAAELAAEKAVDAQISPVVAPPVVVTTSEPKPTLADELSYIERATAALDNRRADVALEEIEAYRRAYPKPRFSVEADAIQVRASQLADQ